MINWVSSWHQEKYLSLSLSVALFASTSFPSQLSFYQWSILIQLPFWYAIVGPLEAVCHSEAVITPPKESNIKYCRWEDGAWRFKCSFPYETSSHYYTVRANDLPLYWPQETWHLMVRTCAPAQYQNCVGWSRAHDRQKSGASEVGLYQSLCNKVWTGQKMGLLPSHVRHGTSHSRPDYCISVSKYQQ